MSKYETLSALVSDIRGCSLIHNDRGNGCGGPGIEDATDVFHAIARGDREDEPLTEVADDDAEAWELAREAFRAHNLNPGGLSMVYLGLRKAGDNGHQVIFAV